MPDVILMDIVMPRLDGIGAIGRIKVAQPGVQIVALTSFIEEEKFLAALESGASGFILKDADADDVASAIRAAHNDEVHLDPAAARILARGMRARMESQAADALTERELEVLSLVGRGRSNKEIATDLGITERTARTHVSNILGKLELKSRPQAALHAVERKLVKVGRGSGVWWWSTPPIPGPAPSPERPPAAMTAAPAASASPPRRTIIFLHGTRLTGASWAVQVAALGESFHCLAPDLPGHGREAQVPFTLDGAVERVAELIAREAEGGRAILVGLSLGGYVATAVAARWPERVWGLAISGATAEPVGLRSLAFRGLASIFRTVPEPVLERVNRWFFGWRFPAEVSGPILADGFSFAGGATAVRSLVGETFKPRLAAYPGPTLLINGEYDLFFRPTEKSFADVAADPRRVVIRRASHLANLDQPAAFSAVIRRFASVID